MRRLYQAMILAGLIIMYLTAGRDDYGTATGQNLLSASQIYCNIAVSAVMIGVGTIGLDHKKRESACKSSTLTSTHMKRQILSSAIVAQKRKECNNEIAKISIR